MGFFKCISFQTWLFWVSMLVFGGVTFVKRRRIHLNRKEGKEQCAVKIHGIEAWVFFMA